MFELIIIPIVVALITQAFKLIIDGIPNNFNWQHLISDYGGMPSSHTAYVSALVMVIGLSQGFNSGVFAVAFVVMIIVMRDAIGFRREIGRNAIFTNIVAKEIFKKKKAEYLNEQMGHSSAEVLAGFVIGSGLAILLYFLLMLI
ncbi:MAG TPA: divergent PAP2 family protein [Patescibacteria group bacterium]|nr:divergent PAP2 family protein [Patescibacteria group bacterium]